MTKGTPPYWNDPPPYPWKKRTWSEEMRQPLMSVTRFLVNPLRFGLRLWIGSFSSAQLQPAQELIVFEGRQSVAARMISLRHSRKPGRGPGHSPRTPWNSQHHSSGAQVGPTSFITTVREKILSILYKYESHIQFL